MAECSKILADLRAMRSETNLAGMARYGIRTDNALGVPLSVLRPIAREHRGDHALALELWATGVREARVLAFLIDDPKQVTRAQMNRWVRDFDSWDVCDGCLIHLFRKTPYAWDKAIEWAKREAEFVRRAGFALMATLAVHEKGEVEKLRAFVPLIEAAEGDRRNFVRKAVVWAKKNVGARISASSRKPRSSRPRDTPSTRTPRGKRDRPKTPRRRPDPD